MTEPERYIAAIHAAWDEQGCGNDNVDCDYCRAYEEAIRAVEWARDNPPAHVPPTDPAALLAERDTLRAYALADASRFADWLIRRADGDGR